MNTLTIKSEHEARQIIERFKRDRILLLKKHAHANSQLHRDIVDVICQYVPQRPTEKQRTFMDLTDFEALYGGAAGGGKSSCLLLLAIYIASLGGSSLVLRRTFSDLSLPGAILDRCISWLANTQVRYDKVSHRFIFPHGGVLQFGYLETENDKYRYQGTEFHAVFFDELTQFSETQYLYLASRIRKSPNDPIPLMLRSASNPGGRGHDWVFRRFVHSPVGVFVPAKLDDNPHIDKAPYIKSMSMLDPITRAQLLEGLWVKDSTTTVYAFSRMRNVCQLADFLRQTALRYILGIDLGASEDKETTAFCVVSYSLRDPDSLWVVESSSHAGLTPSSAADLIKAYQARYVFESIVCDAGALGKGYVEEFRRRHHLPVKPAEKKNKLAYRYVVNGDFNLGKIRLVQQEDDPALNHALLLELESLTWNNSKTDADPGLADHLCLMEGTCIQTPNGEKPIQDIVAGDSVYTSTGIHKVTAAWETGVREIWELHTESGNVLSGTSNHPIKTKRGWVPIDSLVYGDTVFSWSKQLFFAEKHTEDIHNQTKENLEIISYVATEKGQGFIEQYGNITTVILKKAITYIISMAIRLITRYRTLSALAHQTIAVLICKTRQELKKAENQSFLPSKKHQNGTEAKKGKNGILSMAKSLGKQLSKQKKIAKYVFQNLKGIQPRKSAQANAIHHQEENQESITKTGFASFAKNNLQQIDIANRYAVADRVVKIIQTGEKNKVFNLTVDIDHEYFANGILVSNSDAMLYGLREAKHYLSTRPDLPPADPTGRAEWEARRMKEDAIKRAKLIQSERDNRRRHT